MNSVPKALKRHPFPILIILLSLLGGWGSAVYGQNISDEAKEKHPFIKYHLNEISQNPLDNLSYFFLALDKIVKNGDRQINIVQIGDSHTQADIFSNTVRVTLQDFILGGKSPKGFVFPYKMAHSNNPSNYKVQYSGSWTYCRNTSLICEQPLGLSGITVTTTDDSATLTITNSFKDSSRNECNRIRIFYDPSDTAYRIMLTNISKENIESESCFEGVKEWILKEWVKEVSFKFEYKGMGNKKFSLMGLSLESNAPGLVYHTVGVNGAEYASFNRCTYLDKHLTLLSPDLIIISLGTNDAYTHKFDSFYVAGNINNLLGKIHSVLPGVPVIITTPSDFLYKRKYHVTNAYKVSEIIKRVAKKYQYSVWDFYSIMGGKNAIKQWQKAHLAQSDGVHFTYEGYTLQAHLFSEALIKSVDNWIDTK